MPAAVSSWARIEPVQPRPMITTSLCGSLRAILSLFRRPFRTAGESDRRQRKALVMAIDPVEIVVARAREADHFPRAHVAVAAVQRVGEEALLDILDRLLEEFLAVGSIELHAAALEPFEQR